MNRIVTLLMLIAVLSQPLFASGFQINEHGARAMSMGGAFTGLANDPSAVYFNPAGLSNVHGTQFLGGATLIIPASTFRGPSPEITEYKMEDQVFTPINLYVTHQFSDDLTVGLGVNNQYGLGTKWPHEWLGHYVAVETEIVTFFYTLAASWEINDQLSVGAGAVFSNGTVTIKRDNALAPFQGDAFIQLEGDGTAFGFSAGLLWKPMDKLSVGIDYRSQMKFDFEGTAKADFAPEVAALVPTGNITAPLTTPSNFTIGLATYPTECLTVTADFQMVGWSSYDKLEVTFEDVTTSNGEKLVSSSERNYEDSWIARLGAEYKLNDMLDIRGGLIYDKNPVKDEYLDPTLPDADRIGFNVGLGYNLTKNLKIDLAYFFLRFTEREITNSLISYSPGDAPLNGVYNSTAHLMGLNLSYKL